jgi:hypothetical protein
MIPLKCQPKNRRLNKTQKSGLPSEKEVRDKAEKCERDADVVISVEEREAELLTKKEHECVDFYAELIESLPELFR